MLEILKSKTYALNERASKALGAVEAMETEVERMESQICDLMLASTNAEKAKKLLETYATERHEILQTSIQDIVSRGLQVVFQQDLQFRATLKIVREQPECSFTVVIEQDDEEIEFDIANSFGGGLAVVCGVLLRVVILHYLVGMGKAAPLLILDEPLAALSPNYDGDERDSLRQRMANFLKTVADELGIQIILITHEPDYGDEADMYHVFSGGLGEPTKVTTVERLLDCED